MVTSRRLARITSLEERLNRRSVSPREPDSSRLTLDEANQLRDLNLKVDASGWDSPINHEVETAVQLSCRLWGQDLDNPYGHDRAPGRQQEDRGMVE
jgi:hypothetical protein